MTLDETLLRKLAEWRPSPGTRSVLAVTEPDSGWTARLTADRSDELGCLTWEFAVQPGTVPAALDLNTWAARVVAQVTGLLEPLGVHEVDLTRGEALLRSQAPTHRGDHVLYYEVLLQNSGAATVARYQADPKAHTKRQRIAFALTHESVAKLAGDLIASA